MTNHGAPDFKLLFESAPGLFLVLTPQLEIVAASGAYLAATMTTREEILGRRFFEVFPANPADPSATGVRNLRSSLEAVVTHGRPITMAVQKYDIRRRPVDGGAFEERYWSPRSSPVFDQHGKVAFIIHGVEDVTDFVRLKKRGSEQAAAAASLISHAQVMECEVFARAQEIQKANTELRALQTGLESLVQAGTADLLRSNVELQHEVTERERTCAALQRSEEQLGQSQKLEALGGLAAGVAHDFNNLLTVVLTYCELLIRKTASDAPSRGPLEQIKRAGLRAADLTHQLLAFSRQQVLELRILDVNTVVESLSKMLPRLVGEDVELKTLLARDPCLMLGDRGQLEQILMNLIVNARDAMPKGGTLTLETAIVELSEESPRCHPEASARPHVQISVRDTGVGMEPSIQARVFEPFFTTKERGRGTGLGLSTVFGIVKQSGGSICLQSEPGVGTTFKILFPRSEGEAYPAQTPLSDGPLPCGSETILLVEDLEEVRLAIRDVLTTYGYRVIEAGSPGDALLIAENPAATIDLLLTDVVMPRMNGRELSERISLMRPGITVLFMSGYTNDVITHHGVSSPGVAFLQKPLTPETLTRKVRERLDAPGRGRTGETR